MSSAEITHKSGASVRRIRAAPRGMKYCHFQETKMRILKTKQERKIQKGEKKKIRWMRSSFTRSFTPFVLILKFTSSGLHFRVWLRSSAIVSLSVCTAAKGLSLRMNGLNKPVTAQTC